MNVHGTTPWQYAEEYTGYTSAGQASRVASGARGTGPAIGGAEVSGAAHMDVTILVCLWWFGGCYRGGACFQQSPPVTRKV
jgi:hypothetical protein